jgi:hypothetical protein
MVGKHLAALGIVVIAIVAAGVLLYPPAPPEAPEITEIDELVDELEAYLEFENADYDFSMDDLVSEWG